MHCCSVEEWDLTALSGFGVKIWQRVEGRCNIGTCSLYCALIVNELCAYHLHTSSIELVCVFFEIRRVDSGVLFFTHYLDLFQDLSSIRKEYGCAKASFCVGCIHKIRDGFDFDFHQDQPHHHQSAMSSIIMEDWKVSMCSYNMSIAGIELTVSFANMVATSVDLHSPWNHIGSCSLLGEGSQRSLTCP